MHVWLHAIIQHVCINTCVELLVAEGEAGRVVDARQKKEAEIGKRSVTE